MNYLTGIKQHLELEGFKSNEQVITHGVPQGSVQTRTKMNIKLPL